MKNLCLRLILAVVVVCWLPMAYSAAPLSGPLAQVRIDEHLGQMVPLDAVFRDAGGNEHRLGDYFNRKRPVILTLVYYECPMLCTLVLNGLVNSLKQVSLEPGRDFDIVTISINPRETSGLAATKKAAYLKEYKRPGAEAGWHWHVGDDAQIHRVADALGFQYAWDEQSKQYAHQAAIFVLTPEGKISRYLYGIDYNPRDMRLALLEAGREHIASTIDKIILFCFHYDPQARGYSLYAWRLVQVGALATMVVLASVMALFWRRERRAAPASPVPPPGVTPHADKT